ncbi:MAG: Gfo/Idh/MocA family oxidoreductase [SAR324 cluster bacterium]|nr:Gfo/Idh/MocA family oxidoreductase [SAR324 cluster bacterium]MBL7035511.1 Gfo/Idh/MocA family oxidoreductase [SAR324 cluster bacterium]
MIKTAVIGVGYLGRFHAQKYAALADSELIGVVDVDPQQAQKVADELNVPFFEDFKEVLDRVDAVSIVVPTVHHYATAKAFMENGVHVLLEKPFAATIEEAEELEQLSREKNLRLQIGHLERFNPVFTEFQELIERPKFIENIRIAPFPKRGTDVDVILDLMIHDIDLVLAVVGEYPESVEGTGVNIITSTADLANARLRFPSGCIADLTASRVSDKAERKMRIFQSGLYLSLDYGTGQARRLQVDSGSSPDPETLSPESFQLEKGDALLAEIESFLTAVRRGINPKVTAEDGLNAMRVAWQIKDQL